MVNIVAALPSKCTYAYILANQLDRVCFESPKLDLCYKHSDGLRFNPMSSSLD